MERPPRRRPGRLAWLALGALAIAAPIWAAVRISPGARAPGARSGAKTPAAPAPPSVSGTHVDRARVAEPSRTDPRAAAAEQGLVRTAAGVARGDEAAAQPDPARSAEPGPAPAPAPATPGGAADLGAGGPEQDLPHVKAWSATFGGGRALARVAASPDRPWASSRTRTIAGILRRALAHGELSPAPDAETSVPGMRARALAGERSIALWLLAPSEGWGDPVGRAKVTVRGLEPGRWRITWLDDVSGAEIASDERDLDAEAELAVPSFARHVAAVLERDDEP